MNVPGCHRMQNEVTPPKTGLIKPSKPLRRTALSRRSLARFAAIQALYQMEVTGISARQVVREFLEYRLMPVESDTLIELRQLEEGEPYGEADREFFINLVQGVETRRSEIDIRIGKFLDRDWSLERLDHLMRAILRAGAFELMARSDIPPPVAISEYLRLSDAFVGEKGAAFANKVLDQIAREEARPDDGTEIPIQD